MFLFLYFFADLVLQLRADDGLWKSVSFTIKERVPPQ
jgi:hypothetical protein